jgi:GT2 family glycosyltransferase
VTTFDVVILSWNRELETLRLLETIERQHGVESHVWVVDQGSDAACLAAVRIGMKKLKRSSLIELGENRGVSEGRNVGIRAGKAPYVICIDNDAYFEDENAFQMVAKRFSELPDIGAISFRIGEKDGRISISSWPFGSSVEYSQDSPCLVAQFAGSAHALRREALECTKLYDEKLFFFWEELDLCYQLINAGYTILYDPAIRVIHEHSPLARLTWKTGRYYYLVRNGLYVRYKYERSLSGFLMYSLGYTVRGCRNGLMMQSLRGVFDAVAMIRECLATPSEPLNSRVHEYIWEHSLRVRGSPPRRFLKEAFLRLPE